MSRIPAKNGQHIPREVKWAMWGIAISFFFWGPIDAYYSLFLKSFGGDYAQIGWLLSISKLAPLVLAIPMGILIDKISARKTVLFSLAVFLVTPLAAFYAGWQKSLIVLVVMILTQSIAKLIRSIGTDTYIKEATPPELSGRVWSKYEGITVGSWALGLLAGAALVCWLDIYQLFLLVPIGILIKIVVFYRLPEAKKTFYFHFPHLHKMNLRQRMKRGWEHLCSVDRRVFYMLVTMFFFGLTMGNLDVFVVLFADELNFGLPTIALMMGFIYTSRFLAWPLHKISRGWGKFGSMVVGQLIMLLMILGIALWSESTWWIMFILLFGHNLAFMLVKPVRNGIIAALTPADMQGEMSGIQMSILNIANFCGGILFGYVSKFWGVEYVFYVTAVVYGGLFIGFLMLRGKYEHTVRKVVVHPHSSYLSMLHIGHLGHSLPDTDNAYLKGNKRGR